MADWIRMPFGVVNGVGRGMGVLDGVVIVEGEEAVLGVNLVYILLTRYSQMTLGRTCYYYYYYYLLYRLSQ